VAKLQRLIASVITGFCIESGELWRSLSGSRSRPRAATETVVRNVILNLWKYLRGFPPEVIQQLREALENYQPQVAILTPQADEVLQDNPVRVQLQVQDLPIFKNQELDMGPHLHVILTTNHT